MNINHFHPLQLVDRRNFSTAIFLLGSSIFYPFQEARSRFMTFGVGLSTLAVSFNPLRGRINPIAEGHLYRFQGALFSMAVSMLAIGYAFPSVNKSSVKTISAHNFPM